MDDSKQNIAAPKHKRVGFFVLLAMLIAALGVIGWLAWVMLKLNTERTALQNDKQTLQTQVDLLKQQLALAAAVDDAPKDLPCQSTVTDTLKQNIRAAVESRNYAALVPSMASTVTVILAASEGIGDRTPAQAATDMAYLNEGTLPWNFSLAPALIASWDAGFYTDYFDDNTYVGRAANGMVVVFDFNECGKISEVFMVANEELLL